MKRRATFFAPAAAILAAALVAQTPRPPTLAAQPVIDYRVTWDSPGTNYKDSMPIGNGDLGLNIWNEQNGDVVFLIDKTDAWTENGELVKLGRVRLKFDQSPFL